MIYVSLLCLPFMVGACYLSIRLWRGRPVSGQDAVDPYTILFGGAAKDGSVAGLPATSFGMTALVVWYVLDHYLHPYSSAAINAISTGLAVLGMILIVSSLCILLSMQPWFLVPPPVRGRHGLVVASWKAWRTGSHSRR